MKKILSLLLTVSILFALFSFCVISKEVYFDDIELLKLSTTINIIKNSIGYFEETENSPDLSLFKDVLSEADGLISKSASAFDTVKENFDFSLLLGDSDKSGQSDNPAVRLIKSFEEKESDFISEIDDIVYRMNSSDGNEDFRARSQKAQELNNKFNDFYNKYVIDGISAFVNGYRSILLSEFIGWCSGAESERKSGEYDNSSITVTYSETDEGYDLILSSEQNVLSDWSKITGYVIIPAEFLPETIPFNSESFEETVAEVIFENINKAIEENNPEKIRSLNISEFTEEGKEGLTREFIKSVADDAAKTLVYRISCSALSKNRSFAEGSIKTFYDFCRSVASSEDGIDAAVKTVYLTHSFEFETENIIKGLFNRMIVRFGLYGFLMLNMVDKANIIPLEGRNEIPGNYNSSVLTLSEGLKNSLVSKNNYCYLTNTLISYTSVSFNASAKITVKEKNKGRTKAVISSEITDFETIYGSAIPENSKPIGTNDAEVLFCMIRSGGLVPNHVYLKNSLGSGDCPDRSLIITDFSVSKEAFNRDVSYRMFVPFGSYFKNPSSCKSFLKEKSDYIKYAPEIIGDIYDSYAAKSVSETVLNSIAVYAESHKYWSVDETAFFGGPKDLVNCSIDYEILPGENGETIYSFRSLSDYNILISSPFERGSDADPSEYDPLASYNDLLKKIRTEKNDLPEPPDRSSISNDSKIDLYKPFIITGVIIVVLLLIFWTLLYYEIKRREDK